MLGLLVKMEYDFVSFAYSGFCCCCRFYFLPYYTVFVILCRFWFRIYTSPIVHFNNYGANDRFKAYNRCNCT